MGPAGAAGLPGKAGPPVRQPAIFSAIPSVPLNVNLKSHWMTIDNNDNDISRERKEAQELLGRRDFRENP